MRALNTEREGNRNSGAPKATNAKKTFEPRPCGELDYEALADEVMRKYPRILARLGE